MRRALLFILVAPTCVALAACGGDPSEPAPLAIDEPLRLSYTPSGGKPTPGQFFRGELLSGTDGPAILLRGARGRAVFPGEAGLRLSGNVEPTASAVAVKLAGLGTGYWVVPTVDIDDVEIPGKRTIQFNALLDFSRDVPVGSQLLQMVAIDAAGRKGPFPDPLPLSIQPTIPGAAAVAMLSWDTNADVDLQIVQPDGTQIDRKHPQSLPPDADGGVQPGTAALERDSNASCIPDGLRQEMFIWQSELPPGQYLAKADLFTTCGEPGANFVFKFYLAGEKKIEQAGRFLAQDADNGSPGLAVVNFP
jgi:hypothetical protein